MADIVSIGKRSQIMSCIKAKNTKPEKVIRSALHRAGLRFRIHRKELFRESLILYFPKYRAVIMVNGCFFHRHECSIFKWPESNIEFWQTKINGNADRDIVNIQNLRDLGWRVGIIWECALKGRMKLKLPNLVDDVVKWLRSSDKTFEIIGKYE